MAQGINWSKARSILLGFNVFLKDHVLLSALQIERLIELLCIAFHMDLYSYLFFAMSYNE
jgi:hypothetical protein